MKKNDNKQPLCSYSTNIIVLFKPIIFPENKTLFSYYQPLFSLWKLQNSHKQHIIILLAAVIFREQTIVSSLKSTKLSTTKHYCSIENHEFSYLTPWFSY